MIYVHRICAKIRIGSLNLGTALEYIVRKVIVLVNTSLGSDSRVAEELSKIDGVKEVYKVRGVYDILVKIEAPDPDRVKEIISSKLRKIDDIRSTITMVVTNDGISALA